MKLYELFLNKNNKSVPWEVELDSPTSIMYVFHVPDLGKYTVGFHKYKNLGGLPRDSVVWEVAFSLSTPHNIAQMKIVNTHGKQIIVFSTIIQIIKNFLEQHNDFDYLMFSASLKEPSRIRLYRRFAQKLDPNFNEEKNNREIQFIIDKRAINL